LALSPATGAYQLTAILAVRPPEEATLSARLAELSALDISPFGRLAATHYVRLAPFDRLGADRPGEQVEHLGATYLLTSIVFDGDPDRYLMTLARVCRQEVGEIFGCCEGWPGGDDLAAFAAWIRRHECGPLHRFGAVRATGPQIIAALAQRDRLIGFAVGTQDLTAEDLHAAYLREFGPP
jgi:hypothetical protein